MADYLIKGETLSGIADAIRSKTGETESIAVEDMSGKIEGIETGSGGDTSVETCTITLNGVRIEMTLDENYLSGRRWTSTASTGDHIVPKHIKVKVPSYPSGFILGVSPSSSVILLKNSTMGTPSDQYRWYQVEDSVTFFMND